MKCNTGGSVKSTSEPNHLCERTINNQLRLIVTEESTQTVKHFELRGFNPVLKSSDDATTEAVFSHADVDFLDALPSITGAGR